MYEILAHSQVTLNRQIVAAEGSANNMRLLEATGVGALLLTESRKNLNDLFAPGREVVAYEMAYDLVEKIRHYVQDDVNVAESLQLVRREPLRAHVQAAHGGARRPATRSRPRMTATLPRGLAAIARAGERVLRGGRLREREPLSNRRESGRFHVPERKRGY
jgi:hypothetical protein